MTIFTILTRSKRGYFAAKHGWNFVVPEIAGAPVCSHTQFWREEKSQNKRSNIKLHQWFLVREANRNSGGKSLAWHLILKSYFVIILLHRWFEFTCLIKILLFFFFFIVNHYLEFCLHGSLFLLNKYHQSISSGHKKFGSVFNGNNSLKNKISSFSSSFEWYAWSLSSITIHLYFKTRSGIVKLCSLKL